MFTENGNHILIITGQPANGKTTVGRLLHERRNYDCIEGDDFITPLGKIRLNNGTWNDTDRRVYISRMAATAVENQLHHPDVVIVDCLTTRWMREFLVAQITAINQNLAIGFILLNRELSSSQIQDIAADRTAHGHALNLEALIKFRQKFEPWNPVLPHVSLQNPGDGNLDRLLCLTQTAISQLWKI